MHSKSAIALRTYWDVSQVNLEYIIDRAVNQIETGTNENAITRTLKLLAELRGYLVNHTVIDINSQLQVNFSMSGPVLCPHCQRNTLQPPGTAQAQLPSEVLSAEYVPSEQGDST